MHSLRAHSPKRFALLAVAMSGMTRVPGIISYLGSTRPEAVQLEDPSEDCTSDQSV